MSETTARIRELNDAFRTTLFGGRVLVTPSIAHRSDLQQIIYRVMTFNNFCEDNDPYGEHDFGSFQQNGETIFWKLDYYDTNLEGGSTNPADPAVTKRVLTILLASEY